MLFIEVSWLEGSDGMVGQTFFKVLFFIVQLSQSSLEDGYGSAGIPPKELITCKTLDEAIDVAQAIADIETLSDGMAAYEIYLSTRKCAFNFIALGNYEAQWSSGNPQIKVWVVRSIETLDVSEGGSSPYPYVVYAPHALMAIFKACEMSVETDENGNDAIIGCQIPV